jgi:hypothetical protein
MGGTSQGTGGVRVGRRRRRRGIGHFLVFVSDTSHGNRSHGDGTDHPERLFAFEHEEKYHLVSLPKGGFLKFLNFYSQILIFSKS